MRLLENSRSGLAALALAGFGLLGTLPAAAAARIGRLDCNVSNGVGLIVTSQRALSCVFHPTHGRSEYYYGTVRRFGLDLGSIGPGRLGWIVLAASRPGPGALAGNYFGGTASISLGAGIGANALIGGLDNSFALQPLSIETQSGINIAAGIGALTLESGGEVAVPRHHR